MSNVYSFTEDATFGPFDTDQILIIEAWGAQGGGYIGYGVQGSILYDKPGKGGYVKGRTILEAGKTLSIEVGKGGPWSLAMPLEEIYNDGGGGTGGYGLTGWGYPGGGATRVLESLLPGPGSALLVVAGGGGGASGTFLGQSGGHGGGLVAQAGAASATGTGGGGGTTILPASGVGGVGGSAITGFLNGLDGGFGQGGNGSLTEDPDSYYGGGGGGGGYYGGGGGVSGGEVGVEQVYGSGGGGGSSYYDPSVSDVELLAGVRTGHGRVVVTVYDASPLAPDRLTPAAGATVSDDTPQLGAYITTEFVGEQAQQGKVRVEWQLAKDVNFTSAVKTISQTASELRYGSPSGLLTTFDTPTSQRLTQGLWYMRARCIDWNGLTSSWSASQTFTVSRLPTTSGHTPTGDKTIQFVANGVPLSWNYDSANFGSQSAYQVVVQTAVGAPVFDTGKVLSGLRTATVIISAASKNAALRWRVKTWDVDDIEGVYSDWQLFRVGDIPSVSIATIGTDGVVSTPTPTITFGLTPGGGVPIRQRRLFVTRDEDGALVFDTGWVSY